MSDIYLDWAATAPPDPGILQAQANAAVESFANPSSAHAPGKAAKAALDEARRRVAACLKTREDRVLFCSGGTEANQIVLSSLLCRQGSPLLLSTRLEHPSVYECALGLEKRGLRTSFLRADPSGSVDPGLVDLSAAREADMAALSLVNNEIGTILDLPGFMNALRPRGSGKRLHVHLDAVQAMGKIAFFPEELGIDSASFSAHKLGGPRGVGILWLSRPLEAFFRGGGQEGGLRSGTENVPGAIAASLAIEKAQSGLPAARAGALSRMEALVSGIRGLGGAILPESRLSRPESFSPWILQAALPPIPGEALVRVLSDSRCAISTGSACSSSRKGRRVLDALGVAPSISQCAFRVSQGPSTTEAEIAAFLGLLKEAVARLKGGIRG